MIEPGNYTHENNLKAMQELMIFNNGIASICSDDMVAMGVIGTIRKVTLEMSGEVSVMGFDHLRMAARSSCSDITRRCPVLVEKRSGTLDPLMKEINDNEAISLLLMMQGRLIVRASVKDGNNIFFAH